MKNYLLKTYFVLFFIFFANFCFTQDLINKIQLGGSGNNTPFKVAVDDDNSIYIIGTFNGSCDVATPLHTRGGNDVFLIKYDKNGVFSWIRQIGSSGDEFGSGITISPNGFIYITGTYKAQAYAGNDSSIINTGGIDGFIAKYNKNGDLLRFKRIAYGTGNTTQRPNDIHVDKNNNLVIGGYYTSEIILGDPSRQTVFTTSQPLGMFIAIFNENLTLLNAKSYEATNSNSVLYTLDTDNYGYYLCGSFTGSLINTGLGNKNSRFNSTDTYMYKLDYDLNPKWLISVSGDDYDNLFSCSADNKGNVYIGGHFKSLTLNADSNSYGIQSKIIRKNTSQDLKYDVFFAKYSTDGVLQWFNTAGSKENDLLYRALYKNGNFIVAGQYTDTFKLNNQILKPTGNGDAFAIVHDYNDNLKFLIPIVGNGSDIGETAGVDNNGNFIVIGDFTSSKIFFNKKDSLVNSQSGTRDMFIAKYDKASLSKTITQISCAGGNTGAVYVNPMGTVVPPFKYEWIKRGDDTFSGSTNGITGLTAGTYVVTFTDAIGYTKKDSVTLSEPAPLGVTLASKTDATCFNGINGTMNISTSGGVSPYSYVWNGNGSGLTPTAEDQLAVSAGTYAVTVTDKNGCTANLQNVIVDQAPAIHFKGTVVNEILTSPVAPGSVALAVQGGTPDYNYSWTGPSNFTANTRDIGPLNNAGTYNIHVTDTKGCSNDTAVVVNNGTLLIAFIESKQNVRCNNGTDGSATVSALNAVGTLSYSWNNPGAATTATANNLSAGTYYVTVTDAGRPSGSNTSITSVTLTQPLPLEISAVNKTDISCYNENNGILDAVINGGTAPYAYKWTKGGADYATTEDISGLEQAGYALVVTDANGCTANRTASITNPQSIVLNATIVPVTCEDGKDDGAINLDVSGGWQPYTYLWSNGLTTKDISLLPSGSYTVNVADVRNCKTSLTKTIGYESPMVISANVTDVACKGELTGAVSASVSGGHLPLTYAWSNGNSTQNISGLGIGNYTITVTDTKSCVKTYTSTVNEPAASVAVTGSVQDVTCNGNNNGNIQLTATGGTPSYSYLWSGVSATGAVAPNLYAGDYSVTVVDSKNCQTTGSYHVEEPAALGLAEKLSSHVDVTCYGALTGVIELQASGGLGQYQYLMNNGIWSDDPLFSGLAANNYSYKVRDKQATSCVYTLPQSIVITQPLPIVSGQLATSKPACYGLTNGMISYPATGGTGVLSYQLKQNGTGTGNTSGGTNGNFTGVSSGSGYTVEVTDANNCTVSLNGTITLPATEQIAILKDSVKNAASKSPWDGVRLVEASGGTAPLIYKLGTLSKPTGLFTGLAPGDYMIQVTDQNNCGPVNSNTLSVSDVTAVTDLKNIPFSFYPNPTTEDLTLDFGSSTPSAPVEVELISLTGKVVFREKISGLTNGTYVLHLGSIDKGMYLLKLDNKTVQGKVIIQ